MAESRELQLVLTMKNELSKKMDGLNKSISDTKNQTDKAGSSFRNFIGIAAGFVAGGALLRFFQDSVKAAIETQSAYTRLSQILNTTTGATQAQVGALYSQAEALEAVGVISKGSIITAQAQLATFDLQLGSIEKLTPAILNYAVAEKGATATSEDLKQMSNSLAQALQGNFTSLTKVGFVLDEATKKTISHGTETERVTALAEVLNSTYENMNEIMAQTFEGRMIKARNAVENLKESIGMALMPTIEVFLNSLINNANGLALNEAQTIRLSKALYQVANVFIAAIKSVNLIINILVAFGDTMVGVVRTVIAFAKDVINAYRNIGQNISQVFSAIGQAIKGDFSGALATIKTQFSSVYSNTVASTRQITSNLVGWDGRLNDIFSGIGKNMMAGIYGEGFKPVTLSVANMANTVNRNMGAMADDTKDKGKKTADELEKVKKAAEEAEKAFEELTASASDSLFELQENHAKSMSSMVDDMAKVQKSIDDLRKGFNQGNQNDRQRIAEEILKSQNKVADLEKKIEEEKDEAKLALLQAELQKEKDALSDNANFIKGLDSEIAEAKRRQGLTDLERAIEDFNNRRAIAQQEYREKLAILNQELEDIRDKQSQEIQLYNQKREFILSAFDAIKKSHEEMTKKNLEITEEAIKKEIALYKELASAISKVRGSSASEFNRMLTGTKSVNDAVIKPNGQIITTHPKDYLIATQNPKSLGGGGLNVTITGNTFMGKEGVAREIADEIMRAVNMRVKHT